MITKKTWEILRKKQDELDQLIVEKSPTDLKWISHFNATRLKLALLVEVGEFANEIKSFKAWRKKPEIDWAKAQEELIDCLGYFLGLVGIYQIEVDFSIIYPQRGDLTDMREILKSAQEKLKLSFEADPKLKDSEQAKKFAMHFGANIEVEVPKLEKFDRWLYNNPEMSFNELLLEFFTKTNDLYIMEIEEFYTPEENKFNELKKNFPAGTYYYWLSVFNKVCEKLQISEQKLLDIYLTKNKINQQRAQAK